MPPADRIIPRYVAEPPHAAFAGARLRELGAAFLARVTELDGPGEPGEITFYPDRTWHGYTYVPLSAPTDTDMEVFGYVMFPAGEGDGELQAHADFTEETAARNPDWQLDLSDEVVGTWRGADGVVASMTLVWGRALLDGGAVATAELGEVSVDECPLRGDRFTLLAPDDVEGELLEVRLYGAHGVELARESLYAEE